jgi:hypothetical protein
MVEKSKKNAKVENKKAGAGKKGKEPKKDDCSGCECGCGCDCG